MIVGIWNIWVHLFATASFPGCSCKRLFTSASFFLVINLYIWKNRIKNLTCQNIFVSLLFFWQQHFCIDPLVCHFLIASGWFYFNCLFDSEFSRSWCLLFIVFLLNLTCNFTHVTKVWDCRPCWTPTQLLPWQPHIPASCVVMCHF